MERGKHDHYLLVTKLTIPPTYCRHVVPRRRLIDKLEQKREGEDWIARIAEDPEEYITTPLLQHSNTPRLHRS